MSTLADTKLLRHSLAGRPAGAPAKRVRVLVADDSAVSRRAVEIALAQERYELILARSGREALDLVASHAPGILITNWEMPDMTGLDLCRSLRRDRAAFIYIILLTSNAEKKQMVEGLAAGADDYVTKPFHQGELLARVAVGRRLFELHQEIEAKNRLLEEMALTDSLTQLPNRRAVESWAERELKSAARHQFRFWVIVADLDRFKRINDVYGHAAGDAVLKKFAELLQRNTRASNICGRFGGEEFVMVLTHIDRDGVETAIERIRRQLAATRYDFSTSEMVTASFGISCFEGPVAPLFSQLIQDADTAMYCAKNKGRNRIEFAE